MEKADKTAFYTLAIGLGAAVIGTALPSEFPGVAPIVWHVLFWGGVAATLFAAFLLLDLHFFKKLGRPTKATINGVAVLGFVVLLVWRFQYYEYDMSRQDHLAIIPTATDIAQNLFSLKSSPREELRASFFFQDDINKNLVMRYTFRNLGNQEALVDSVSIFEFVSNFPVGELDKAVFTCETAKPMDLVLIQSAMMIMGNGAQVGNTKDGEKSVYFATRAESAHSGSYPAAANMLMHSVGVMSLMRRAMADQSVSTVRAASLRSSALSLAKAFSIGLKSGL